MDPLTLAAVTGGFAAVKSAISGVRSALESADDVSSIATHIDMLFKKDFLYFFERGIR